MKLNELFADDQAVSPVVGVALLIAITVILAAVIGGVVLGLGTGGAETPQAQLNAEFTDGNDDGDVDNVTITHNGGEPLNADEVVITNGSSDTTLNGDMTAGDSIELDASDFGGAEGDEVSEITVLWEDPESDSESVIAEFEP